MALASSIERSLPDFDMHYCKRAKTPVRCMALAAACLMAVMPLLVLPGVAWRVLHAAWVWCVARRCVLCNFLLGGVEHGLVTLCRKGCLRDAQCTAVPFQQQGGDWLNLFRSRGSVIVTGRLASGKPLQIVNTHLNRSLNNCASAEAMQQAAEALADPGLPQIICGDFNMTPDDLLRQLPANVSNASPGCVTWHKENVLTHKLGQRPMSTQLDYAIVRRSLPFTPAQVVANNGLSDHYLVVFTAG